MRLAYQIIGMFVIPLGLLMSGCSGSDIKDGKTVQQVNSTENIKETDTEEKQTLQNVTVYYVDDLSGNVVGETMEIRNEFDIWSALKEKGILTEECVLNSIRLNHDKTMELDFNQATADRINSMGTTGETEIIGCIVNTYLEAYDCEGIRLLVEGEDFVSSHGAEFNKYQGKIEFK